MSSQAFSMAWICSVLSPVRAVAGSSITGFRWPTTVGTWTRADSMRAIVFVTPKAFESCFSFAFRGSVTGFVICLRSFCSCVHPPRCHRLRPNTPMSQPVTMKGSELLTFSIRRSIKGGLGIATAGTGVCGISITASVLVLTSGSIGCNFS